jgi:alpha-L-fucosidase
VGAYSYNAQGILRMLQSVCRHSGNLLLNIGPRADGAVPTEAVEPLETVGRWLAAHGDAVYGPLHRSAPHAANGTCGFTQRGNKLYAWQWIWTDDLIFGGFATKLKSVRTVPGGQDVAFKQTPAQIIIPSLPGDARDTIAKVTVLELEFEEPPVHRFCLAYPQLHRGRDWLAETRS